MRAVLRQLTRRRATAALAAGTGLSGRGFLLFATLGVPVAWAQLPLSIEALLVPESTLTLSAQTHWHQARQPTLVSRSAGAGGALLSIGQRRIEQVSSSIGARYGVARGLELSAGVSHSRSRWREPGGAVEQADGDSVDVGLGWLVLPERGAPALLLDARADLVARPALPGAERAWLDGVEFGAIAYRSLDPVVLSLSARYRDQRKRSHAAGASPASRTVLVAPQVNFAINSSVTLVGGMSMHYRRVQGVTDAERTSGISTALRLGLGYAASGSSTVFLNTSVATSGPSHGAGFDVEWLYRFQ